MPALRTQIVRMVDGREHTFTLDPNEEYQAYLAQQRYFDKLNVQNYVSDYCEDYGLTAEQAAELINDDKWVENQAVNVRNGLDKFGVEISEENTRVIGKAIKQRFRKNEGGSHDEKDHE